MKSPDRFLSDATTNDRIPHRRLVMKAKGSVPAHATLATVSLSLRNSWEYRGTLELSCRSLALGCTKTTRTTSEAGRSSSQQPNTARDTTAPSAFASSSEGSFMLNHHLGESYHNE